MPTLRVGRAESSQNSTKTACGFLRRRNDTTHTSKAVRRLGHPEHARGVDAMATYFKISPRTSNFLQLKSVSDEQQKAPQAGSTESLIYPVKGKELFIEKGRNFTHVGVDQTFRRSLRGASTPWFCSIRYAHLRKTSTRPSGSLRMTRSRRLGPPRQQSHSVFIKIKSTPNTARTHSQPSRCTE
jgi:hypothetical protein